MDWLAQLQDVVGWRGLRTSIDWEVVEGQLGIALPDSYKEYSEVFGPGSLCGLIDVYVPESAGSTRGLVEKVRDLADRVAGNAWIADLYEPYKVYPNRGGLIEWGASEIGDSFFWNTSSRNPDKWEIVVKEEGEFTWLVYEMSIPEFLYRVMTDGQMGGMYIGGRMDSFSFLPRRN
ncbi:hypothetical protein ACWGB8_12950 [Kitasatospora sp. NPDC054939]